MKISFDGQVYDVPRDKEERLLADLLTEGAKDYQKLDKKWRVIAQGAARAVLGLLEMKARDKKAAAAQLRPARGEDPVLKLGPVFAGMLLEGLKHVHLYVATTDSGAVDTFHLAIEQGTGEAGRLMDSHGSAGQRQDNRAEVP